jgi:hypothetical protein
MQMLTKIDEKTKKITWKHWVLFLLLSQIIYIIMLRKTIPGIQEEAGGMKIFDLQPFGYSTDYVYRFFSQLSEKGYTLYKLVQLPLDTLYPLLNFLTGISTFILLNRIFLKLYTRSIQKKYSIYASIMLLLPFFAMIFDYLKNIIVFIMLSYKGAISKGFILASSSFTIIKSLSITFFYGMCLMMCMTIGIYWVYKKFIRGNTDE